MFKKVELWVVLLICLAFFIGTIFYGALLRHHYLLGDNYRQLQKIAIFFAELPSNIKHQNFSNKVPEFVKNKSKPRFKRFINTERDVILVLPRYDGNLNRSVIELIDLNNFEVIHTYKHDINSMNDLIDTSSRNHQDLKSELRFQNRHPLILNDGSVLSISSNSLFKIDYCSNLEWFNQETKVHHSINKDADNNYWIGGKLYPYSKTISRFKKDYGFFEDSIAKISENGELLYEKSIPEMLIENKILGERMFVETLDPIHLNDVQPALTNTKFWKKNDLFLSSRHKSAIIHYRPSTNKVINYIQGPFFLQHDVDIISDKEISIFNNNGSGSEDNEYSNVVIYNFETKTFSFKYKEGFKDNNIKTITEGLSEILKDGSMLVEEQNHGRLIFFDNKGNKEWEYVNKDDQGRVFFISWSRIIENKNLIKDIKNKANNTKCLK
jgi:hypothetical protein